MAVAALLAAWELMVLVMLAQPSSTP